MTEIAALLTRPIRRLGRPSKIAIAVALVLAAGAGAVAVRAYALRDSVLPGVRVAGVDVGGLSRADARSRIEMAIGERLRGRIDLSIAGDELIVRPSRLFTLDVGATERLAFASARRSFTDRVGALAAPFAVRHDVEPVLRVDPVARAALARKIARRTDKPVSATISMRATSPVVEAAASGTAVDLTGLLDQIRDAALGGLPAVEARVTSVSPAITTAAAERAAATARTAVSGPVDIRFRHEDVGRLGPEQLAGLLRFRAHDGRYRLALDAGTLRDELTPLVRPFARKPVDASFEVVGERVQVVKARNGTTLDAAAARRAVRAAAVTLDDRHARVRLTTLEPELTTREARSLGIRRQVSTYTTDMGPSSANRIWNVHLMADYIDGTIIRPGKTFSFNEVVGPRTAARGFREGQMIIGSLLVPAIGGGVCQTATTLFNNAFDLGLPVTERHNHSWYISHYPIGRDATVSWGGPDLRFENDLDHALLIKTSYTDSTLTFTFFGKPQGRKVVATTGPQKNFREPKTSYAYDPNAPEGSVRTVAGSHEQGFDITVFRTVSERGRVIRKDSFTSHYVAVGDTTIYGPGTHPPRIDFYLPAV